MADLPFATLTQSWGYGEACRAAMGHRVSRLLIERDEAPIAICQIVQERVFGFPVLSRARRGPLFFAEAPTASEIAGVLRLLRRWCCAPRGGLLLVALGLKRDSGVEEGFAASGYWKRRRLGWRSALIDLDRDLEEIRGEFKKEWRNRLRPALCTPLTVEFAIDADTLEWLIERREQNMRDKQFEGPSGAFLRSMLDAAPGTVVVARAKLEGEPVAGMMVVRYGRFADFFVAWFGEEARRLNGGNFLYWRCLGEMKRLGVKWLDLGGYSIPDRYGRFKAGLRGEVYQLADEWMTF